MAFFYGAGISIKSGLPAGFQLKSTLVGGCTAVNRDIDSVCRTALPLEDILDNFSVYTNIDPLLRIFENGKPNATHILLAHLIDSGFVNDVCTTNFDCLVEKSLHACGPIDFNLLTSDQYNKNPTIPTIFKLHGTISDRKSMMLRIRDVARKKRNKLTIDALNHIFSTGPHDVVLVMGYSCSDHFDINPIIRNMSGPRKTILYLKHCEKGSDTPQILNLETPFEGYDGSSLVVNTDTFMSDLLNGLMPHIKDPVRLKKSLLVAKTDRPDLNLWKARVEEWKTQVSGPNAYRANLIMGAFLYTLSKYKLADKYYSLIPKETRNTSIIALSYSKRSTCLYNVGTSEGLRKASLFASRSLRLLPETKELIHMRNKDEIALNAAAMAHHREVYIHLEGADDEMKTGSKEKEIAHLEMAKNHLDEALSLFKVLQQHPGLIGCNLLDGRLHQHMASLVEDPTSNQLKMALDAYRRASRIALDHGDVDGEAASLNGIGNVYYSMRRFKKARNSHERALTIYEKLDRKREIAIVLMHLADDYKSESSILPLSFRLCASLLLKEISDRRLNRDNSQKMNSLKESLYL